MFSQGPEQTEMVFPGAPKWAPHTNWRFDVHHAHGQGKDNSILSSFYTVVPKGYKTEWKICLVIVNMQVLPFEMKPPSTNVYMVYRFQNFPHLPETYINLLTTLCVLSQTFVAILMMYIHLISDYFAQILCEV